MTQKSLISVIEGLLESTLTEAEQNAQNAKHQVVKQEKQKTSPDTQGVLGKEKGAALDAGGDKDVGGKKGKNASDASAEVEADKGPHSQGGDEIEKNSKLKEAEGDTDGVLGKGTKGAALDAGGDKDVGKLKEEDEVEEELKGDQHKLDKDKDGDIESDDLADLRKEEACDTEVKEEEDEDAVKEASQEPSNAKNAVDKQEKQKTSPDTQGVLGKTKGAALDGGGDKDVGKLKEAAGDDEEDTGGDTVDLTITVGKEDLMNSIIGAEPSEDEEGSVDVETDKSEEEEKPAEKKKEVKEESEDDEEESDDEDDELEEDFKEKATIIFETAVNEKARLIREQVEAEFTAKLAEEKARMDEQIADFVDTAVQEWLKENKLEIKYSLRTEIAENFIGGLKKLFAENYIEIPEEDVSVVDELTETVESYKEQLEEQSQALEEAQAQILAFKRQEIIDDITEDLTETQKIRLEKLSESVEAGDIDEFRYKVEQLKESFFNGVSGQPLLSSLSEEVFGGQRVLEEDTSPVSQYANFLSRTVFK